MIKPITTSIFSKYTPIKNIEKLTKKEIQRTNFTKPDSPTGFFINQLVKNNNKKCMNVAPEIFY